MAVNGVCRKKGGGERGLALRSRKELPYVKYHTIIPQAVRNRITGIHSDARTE